MREIVNSILYQGRTGCQWAHLPHDFGRSARRTTTSWPGGRRDRPGHPRITALPGEGGGPPVREPDPGGAGLWRCACSRGRATRRSPGRRPWPAEPMPS
ncbi:transposase [Streptomyces sp. NPDC002911]